MKSVCFSDIKQPHFQWHLDWNNLIFPACLRFAGCPLWGQCCFSNGWVPSDLPHLQFSGGWWLKVGRSGSQLDRTRRVDFWSLTCWRSFGTGRGEPRTPVGCDDLLGEADYLDLAELGLKRSIRVECNRIFHDFSWKIDNTHKDIHVYVYMCIPLVEMYGSRFYLLLITWASRRTVLVSSNSQVSLVKAHLISPDQFEQPVTLDDPFEIGLIIFFWSPNAVMWYIGWYFVFQLDIPQTTSFVFLDQNVLEQEIPQKWVQWAPVGPSNRNRSLENWGAQFFHWTMDDGRKGSKIQ